MTSSQLTRELKVVLNHDTAKTLGDSGYHLHIAKSVISQNGTLSFNVIWQSHTIAPVVTVDWVPVYAFNWTAQVPSPGMTVEVGGDWTQCNVGQVLDIDKYGYFSASASAPDNSVMKIGRNNYVSDGEGGVIHIVIGIQNQANGSFAPIFVDPDGIYPNFSASFQPQEKVQWWYESGDQTGTMVDTHDTPIETGDFSAPDPQTGTYKKQSSYDSVKGTWTTQAIKCRSQITRLHQLLADSHRETLPRIATV